MVRTRVRWGRVGGLVLSAAAAVTLAGGVARAGGTEATRAYTIRAGDTVWTIARGLAGPSADVRPLVDRIVSENGLDPGALQVGQRIALPGDL